MMATKAMASPWNAAFHRSQRTATRIAERRGLRPVETLRHRGCMVSVPSRTHSTAHPTIHSSTCGIVPTLRHGSMLNAVSMDLSARRFGGTHTETEGGGNVLHSEILVNNKAAASDAPFVFLHGLLGNGKNLKTFARSAIAQTNVPSGMLLDLRGHGKSKSAVYPLPNTFESAAHDVRRTLLASTGASSSSSQLVPLPRSIVGHSWGGRVTLQYASMFSGKDSAYDGLRSIWLLDTVPGQVNDSVEQVLSSIQRFRDDALGQSQQGEASTEITIPSSNKELLELFTSEYKLSMPIAQWLLSSYDASTRTFSFDMQIAQDQLAEFERQDFYGLVASILEENDDDFQIHLVRGGKNAGWDVGTLQQLQNVQNQHPNRFHVHVLPKAGHWVHIDDRAGLVQLIESYEKM